VKILVTALDESAFDHVGIPATGRKAQRQQQTDYYQAQRSSSAGHGFDPLIKNIAGMRVADTVQDTWTRDGTSNLRSTALRTSPVTGVGVPVSTGPVEILLTFVDSKSVIVWALGSF
jgi:hypothetical protein